MKICLNIKEKTTTKNMSLKDSQKSREQLVEVLINIGLTDKESRVYLTMLTLGRASITSIAKASEIKRTTVYSIIESLKFQGLVTTEIKGLKTIYVAENPEKLASVLDNKKKNLQGVLPQFLELYNHKGSIGFIKKYDGFEAVKTVYENILLDAVPEDDYLVMANQEKWIETSRQFFQKYIEKRSKIGMESRFIFQDSEIARYYKQFEKNWSSEIKIFPKGVVLDTNIIITRNKLIMQKLNEPLSTIVIEDKDVASTYREIFNLIWRLHN